MRHRFFWGVIFLLCLIPSLVPAITLRMIGPEDVSGAWKEIIHRFEAQNPGITIDYITGPWSTDERQNIYIRSFLGGEPIEIVYMDITWTARFAQKGWLIPLDYWIKIPSGSFIPGALKAGYYRGRLYRLPVTADVGLLYYRRDLIPDPPRTWAKLLDYCRLKKRQACFVFQAMQYEGLTCNFLEHLWGFGGSLLNNSQKRPMIEALSFMRRLVDDGLSPRAVLSYQEQQSLAAFAQGQALFMRNWPYAWQVLNRIGSPLKGKVGLAPLPRHGERPASGVLGGWGLGIAKGTKDPEAAARFIKYAVSLEAQKILFRRRGEVPARRDFYHDPKVINTYPYLEAVYEALLSARPRPSHPRYSQMSDSLQKHVSAVLAGIESPEVATERILKSLEGIKAGEVGGLFRRLIRDYDLRRTLFNTLIFTGLSVPLEFLLGFLVALFIDSRFPGAGPVRLVVLVPWALPTAVMAMSWQWMFNNPFGVINDLLLRAGLIAAPLDWLSHPQGAMAVAILADVWKTTPFVTIILLAGLKTIPTELKESMVLEGAGPLRRLISLTWPLILPFVRVALVFRILQAVGIFDLIWVLTRGGPADSTKTICLYIYDLAFRFDDLKYASFLTLMLLIALMLISALVVRLTTPAYERRGA